MQQMTSNLRSDCHTDLPLLLPSPFYRWSEILGTMYLCGAIWYMSTSIYLGTTDPFVYCQVVYAYKMFPQNMIHILSSDEAVTVVVTE